MLSETKKKSISLELGGKTRELRFNLCTLRTLLSLTGDDPESFFGGGDLSKQLNQVASIAHAGLLSDCSFAKEEPDFTGEDVRLWIEDLSTDEMLSILNTFSANCKASN